jgi:hypothetical protein
LSRKKIIWREVRNTGIDGGLLRGSGPKSMGIILPDQRHLHFNTFRPFYLYYMDSAVFVQSE